MMFPFSLGQHRDEDKDDELPVHSPQIESARDKRTIRVQGRKPFRETVSKYLNLTRRALFDLPSEPSDPLRDSTNSGVTTASDVQSNYQATHQAREKLALQDDEDWFVDQTIVTSENIQHGNPELEQERERSGTVDDSFAWDSDYGYLRSSIWRQPSRIPRVFLRRMGRFFDLSFSDAKVEREYQKENWYAMKTPARWTAVYLIINWALFLGLYDMTHLYEQIIYYGGLSVVTLSAFLMIIFDMPNASSPLVRTAFQCSICAATWFCGITLLIDAYVCGFFASGSDNTCGGKNFLALLFYITAMPTISLFTILRRLYHATAQVITFVLMVVLILPYADQKNVYIRALVNYALFSLFILWLHYSKEKAKRRLFVKQAQIRRLYRAVHKAQQAEKIASESKQQFSSYIFHEVRVPLNIAILALDNLRTKGFLDIEDPDSKIDVYALEGSLNMTAQILNDVLDLQHMVSKRFKLEPSPFPFHRSIESTLKFMDVETKEKDITLNVELDRRLDSVVSYPHRRATEGLWVFGAELRLRQLLGNLTSNAVKFTPAGGKIRVATRLLWPLADTDVVVDNPLIQRAKASSEKAVVVRLEVQDSGPGIKPSDLWGTSLFQPFVQTSVGKNSGTGSGLGLAIVKSITTLSGGRLGIKSRRNEGALFWVELVYPLATSEQVATASFVTPPASPTDAPRSILQLSSRSLSHTSPSITPPLPSPTSSLSTEPPEMSLSRPPYMRSLSDVLTSAASQPHGSIEHQGAPSGYADVSEDSASLRVLVVDDDERTRRILARSLEMKYGCIVETASDGEKALEMIIGPRPDGKGTTRYDLIFMDNLMPSMSGEECVRRLRNYGRDEFIIGCTGNALNEDTAKYKQAGCDHVLTKPVLPSSYSPYILKARELRMIRLEKADGVHRRDFAFQ